MWTPRLLSFETDELNLELKHRLPETFVEFRPYLDQCRFVGCSHTKEKGCAVLEAVRAGKIQRSRHASYVRLYEELKPLRTGRSGRSESRGRGGQMPASFCVPAFCTRTGSGVYNGSEKGAWGVCFGEAADAGYWASVRWRWGPGS